MRYIFLSILIFLTYQVVMLSRKLPTLAWRLLGCGFISTLTLNITSLFIRDWFVAHLYVVYIWQLFTAFCLVGGFHTLKKDLDNLEKFK